MATVGVKGLTINCYVHVDVEPITLTQFIYTDAQKKIHMLKRKQMMKITDVYTNRLCTQICRAVQNITKKLHDDDDRPIL